MRAVIACLAILFVASVVAVAPTEEETRFLFTKWVEQHKKSYTSQVELHNRYNNFKNNLAFITKHNEEAALGLHTFTVAMNQFGDMTQDEYRAMLTYKAGSHPAPEVHRSRIGALPTSVDWRTKGVVTGIKDQGQCGSCWSFSAVASMEGAHALATGSLISLSEQNLVDCVDNGQCTCDVGGYMQWGFQWAIDNHGIETEANYPYCACSNGKCKYVTNNSAATFSSYVNVTVGSETDLQSAVASRPGVSVAIDASSIFFQFYSSGVYNYPLCGNQFNNLDHGVFVVGYDTTSGGVDYWIVKNSWGTSWGQQGYIWMSRNKNNQCGIATDASYVLV